MMKAGKPVINGWLQIPSTVSAEVMAHQGWDSLTIDMQHGLVDYTNALPMLQTISTTDVTPLARVNWNEPGQIMKILDAGCYGIICPMVSNKEEAERFVQACMYPPHGYRSFGPVRGLIYGGSDYAKHANDEMLKLAMIETKESLDKLDEIMSTPGVDGIYIGPADLSLAIGEEPGFDRPESTKAYSEILRILEHAKKYNIYAGIHNGTPEYAQKMIDKGFNFVTIGADQRALSSGAKAVVDKIAEQLEVLKGTYQDIYDLFCHIKNKDWDESALYFSSHLLNPEHFKHLLDYFEVEIDTVYEIGLTPNRADAMSHLGVARDLKALCTLRNIPFEWSVPETSSFHVDTTQKTIPVEIEDSEKCLQYHGLTLTNRSSSNEECFHRYNNTGVCGLLQ